MRSISILILVFFHASIFGQSKLVTGKILDNFSLSPLPGIVIGYRDSSNVAITDNAGNFKTEIPKDVQSLNFHGVGLEPAIIHFKNDCDHLEIIMILQSTYDFMTLQKVDRLRLRQFKQLPKLHNEAYQAGKFKTEKACYEQLFIREANQ